MHQHCLPLAFYNAVFGKYVFDSGSAPDELSVPDVNTVSNVDLVFLDRPSTEPVFILGFLFDVLLDFLKLELKQKPKSLQFYIEIIL